VVIQRWRSEREKCLILLASGGDCELHNEEPEDLRDVIAAYHKCAAAIVQRFDGFLAQFLGDGVLVYFGYPKAHEDRC